MILADMAGEQTAASWSPDGRRIVFVDRLPADSGTLWTVAADGTGAAQLYGANGECPGGAFHPRYSADGARLAFVCYGADDSSAISVLDLATMKRTDLAKVVSPEFIDSLPSWSPDDSTIAFDIIQFDPTNQFVAGQLVATVPAAGGKVRRITKFDAFLCAPDWSPDGTRLAINSYDVGTMHGIEQPSNIYTIAPDGSGLKQLTTLSTDGHLRFGQPQWSPDGSRIWVSVGREWETWPDGHPHYGIGWVDPATGDVHDLNLEGKRPKLRPVP